MTYFFNISKDCGLECIERIHLLYANVTAICKGNIQINEALANNSNNICYFSAKEYYDLYNTRPIIQ